MEPFIASNRVHLFKVILVCVVTLLFFTGCHKTHSESSDTTSINQLNLSPTFNWATTRNVDISLSAKDNTDNPLSGVRFTMYTANPDSGGVYLVSGISGEDGMWQAMASIPASVNKVTALRYGVR